MCVGKCQAICRQSVQVERGNSAVAVLDGDITIAHVVSHDKDDIWLLRFRNNCDQCHITKTGKTNEVADGITFQNRSPTNACPASTDQLNVSNGQIIKSRR